MVLVFGSIRNVGWVRDAVKLAEGAGGDCFLGLHPEHAPRDDSLEGSREVKGLDRSRAKLSSR